MLQQTHISDIRQAFNSRLLGIQAVPGDDSDNWLDSFSFSSSSHCMYKHMQMSMHEGMKQNFYIIACYYTSFWDCSVSLIIGPIWTFFFKSICYHDKNYKKLSCQLFSKTMQTTKKVLLIFFFFQYHHATSHN